jgi:hypothetical protein
MGANIPNQIATVILSTVALGISLGAACAEDVSFTIVIKNKSASALEVFVADKNLGQTEILHVKSLGSTAKVESTKPALAKLTGKPPHLGTDINWKVVGNFDKDGNPLFDKDGKPLKPNAKELRVTWCGNSQTFQDKSIVEVGI